MGRILKAYETRFCSMLKQAGARRPEQGTEWLVTRARKLSAMSGLPLYAALTQVYQKLQRQVLSPKRQASVTRASADKLQFWCDSGLVVSAAGSEQPDTMPFGILVSTTPNWCDAHGRTRGACSPRTAC